MKAFGNLMSLSTPTTQRCGALVLALCLVLSFSPMARADDNISDPLEPINRGIFEFNRVFDGLLLRPMSELYGLLVPDLMKTGIRNFLDNLRSPIVFANDLMQGERERAGITLSRFMVNSTFGIGGLIDFAKEFNIEQGHDEDFGQTLGSYGVGPGPYIVLPFFGPSTARDTVGLAVDSFVLDPVAYLAPTDVRIARLAVDGVETRYRLTPAIDDLESGSLDFYSTVRSVYLQRRESEIRNGEAQPVDDSYEDIFGEEFEDE